MSGSASVTIRGNVGKDPEIRFMPSGDAVCNFSVAVSERKKNGDSWEDLPPVWYRVSVFGRDAEAVAEILRQGNKVVVSGTQTVDTFTDRAGQERQQIVIKADWGGVGIVPKISAVGGGREKQEEVDPW
jgi:single-strand DNA-binding protein